MAPTPPDLPAFMWHLFDLYNTYIDPYLPSALQSMNSHLSPILTSAISAASNGDIVSLAAFLLTIYLTIRIADYIRRSVIAWIMFFVKIAIILVLVNVAFYVNRYGFNKALNDVEWIFGLLWGLVEDKMMNGSGQDNRTGWHAGNGGSQWNTYGGRQQVPVGRTKRRGGGWT